MTKMAGKVVLILLAVAAERQAVLVIVVATHTTSSTPFLATCGLGEIVSCRFIVALAASYLDSGLRCYR